MLQTLTLESRRLERVWLGVPARVSVDGHLSDNDSAAAWNIVPTKLAVNCGLPRVVWYSWIPVVGSAVVSNVNEASVRKLK